MIRASLGLIALIGVFVPAASAQCDCDMGSKDSSLSKTLGEGALRVATSPITWGTVGLGLGGVLLVAWRLGWAHRGLALLALWSRFASDELDEHPTRARILEALRQNPGVTTQDLAEIVELNSGTLLYHLEILSQFRLVSSQRIGRQRAWHVAQGAPPDPATLAALAVPARQRLLDLIENEPGTTPTLLAQTVGLSPATVHHHLQVLARAGLVELRRQGNRLRCHPVRSHARGSSAVVGRSGVGSPNPAT